MENQVLRLMGQIDPHRLEMLTMDLVRIPSPSGQEGEVAERYAKMLAESGMSVEIDREYPESPTVIGRLKLGEGPTLQFDGHLDTVPTPHEAPKVEKGRIYGRGSADMKGGLAAVAEVCRVLRNTELPGSLLVTAHGQHELPVGGNRLHAPLFGLFDRGIRGDAAIVAEGPSSHVPLRARGLIIFRVAIKRRGDPVHELSVPPPPNPIDAARVLLSRFDALRHGWNEAADRELGPESIFIGSISGGDLYNRVPSQCVISGTRRNLPGHEAEDAEAELKTIAREVAEETHTTVDVEITRSGQPYQVSEMEPLVVALRNGYRQVTGETLPVGAMRIVTNASQFNTYGGIPALSYGIGLDRAHADIEFIELSALSRIAKIYLAAAVGYLSPERRG